MPFIPIENVSTLGLIFDTPTYNLPPEAWSSVVNVRFVDGKAEKSSGDLAVYGTPPIAPYWLLSWELPTVQRWIYAGRYKVYYTDGAAHVNITRYTTLPGDADYDAGAFPVWTGGILHGVPFLNNNVGTDPPQQWDGALGRLKNLDNWPASTYAAVVRNYLNFLVALDITKGANRYPTMVKWSHPADAGTVPVSWNEADLTRLAGEYPLAQTPGDLVDCLPLGGVNIIYKTDSIWAMQPTGGLDVFRFTNLSTSAGLLAPNCVVEFHRTHFVVGTDDIYLFDGNTPRSIITERLRKWFFGKIHREFFELTTVVRNTAKQEIWICFVSASSSAGIMDTALIWNWINNTWTVKDLPGCSYVAPGKIFKPAETFDTAVGTFDERFEPIDSTSISTVETQLVAAKADSPALLHLDVGYTSLGVGYNSVLERTGLALVGFTRDGAPRVSLTSRKFLRGVYPKITAPTATVIKVLVGVQEYPDGPITWSPPQDFHVPTMHKVNFAMSGRIINIRFESTDSIPWALTGYALDLEVIAEE